MKILSSDGRSTRMGERAPTILVVEDYEEIRLLLKSALESANYRVIVARDGNEAITLSQAEHPDLILMDIGLPERSGISATYWIKKDPELQHVPVLALTAFDVPDVRADALKAGVDEFLTKPIDIESLKEIVGKLLPRGSGR